nr:MAG TPA: hypothetical protein [Caudoviricetes sp.]
MFLSTAAFLLSIHPPYTLGVGVGTGSIWAQM